MIGSRVRSDAHQAPRALVPRAAQADRGAAAVPMGCVDKMSRRMLCVEPLDCVKLLSLTIQDCHDVSNAVQHKDEHSMMTILNDAEMEK